MYRLLEFREEHPVATLTLANAGSGNRIDAVLAAELREACRAVMDDEDIHLLILTGSGEVFSVGRETKQEDSAPGLDWMVQLQVASTLAALPIPILVAVNGDALDHGLELALAGDLRVAASNARLGLTDLSRGVLPWDGGTQRLPRLVGQAWARDMILTSRVIDAHQALALGLVNRVVEADRLMAEVRQLADTILMGGPIAARYAKEALRKGMDLSLGQGLGLEADLNVILQSTADRAEGIQSFLQKRQPKFTGR
ncbi:MAG: enoyl-CoA hydratase/isomerase family protein [Chloroflexi bacterium]|nr:enoyl-CoA hydratase/isomerase family protein [Chloroflexota bacterium]MCH8225743.1 enoyl-CoA hydratase/isomerase family protein [Chloroflexota bacterium]